MRVILGPRTNAPGADSPARTDEISLHFDYSYCANDRILSTAAKVSPEQYAAPTDSDTFLSQRPGNAAR